MKFDKQQKEWLAFELYRSFCEKREILTYEKTESPDFIVVTQKSTVGLEVTESITEVFAHIDDFLTMDMIIEVLEPIFVVEKDDYRAKLCELIAKKLMKLNEIYKVYNENKIFVLAPFSFLSDAVDFENLLTDINKLVFDYNTIYDELFIYTGKCILRYAAYYGVYKYNVINTNEEKVKSIISEIIR